MKKYVPPPPDPFTLNDPTPDEIRVSRFSGSRKILGGGRANVLSPQPEDGFIAQEKRAAHWLGIWENFWSGT